MPEAPDAAAAFEVGDARRPPFCYQTHAALDAIRAHYSGDKPYGKLPTALGLYCVLTEAANRAGGSEARSSFTALRKSIAEATGVSTDTLDLYVVELEKAGVLRVRRNKAGAVNLPNVWSLVEPESPGRVDSPPGRVGSATLAESTRPLARERLAEPKKGPEEPPLAPPQGGMLSAPPPVTLVGNRRNLPLEALAEVSGIDPESPRMAEAAAALNGRPRARNPEAHRGIRQLCWIELERMAAPDWLRSLHDEPRKFEEGLARTIRKKADLYREKMPGAYLTPTALRRHWLDLELAADGRLTPDQIRAAL